MTRPAAPRVPFRALRRGLLLLLAVLVLGIGGLYLLGRQQGGVGAGEDASDGTRGEEASHAGGALGPTGDVIAWSEGFEFEQKVGDRSAFRLSGERFATDREGVTRLEGVLVELAREGEPYRVSSRRAVWDPETQEARFLGEVRLVGGDELWLESARLDLIEDGRFLVSERSARFGSGDGLEGRANELRFDFERDRLVLQGRVRVTERGTAEEAPMTLEAPQVVYARAARKLVASGGVELAAGPDRVRAREILLELGPDAETPRRAIARGDVAGGFQLGDEEGSQEETTETSAEEPAEAGAEAAPEAPEEAGEVGGEEEEEEEEEGDDGRIRFRARVARVELGGEGGSISSVELEGGEEGPARIRLRDPQGGSRLLRAPRVVARLEAGALREASAEGGVLIRERARSGAGRGGRRTATGESAVASFTELGELERMTLTGEVRIEEPNLEAWGERAVLEAATGSGALTGGKVPARARSDRGEIEAPEILFERDGERVRARGGVRATLESSDGRGVELGPAENGDGAGPVRVEARTAEWDDAARSWRFEGDVRAAQGERLLFAEVLAGDEARQVTTASGGVRTLWKQDEPGAAAPVQTAVSAQSVVYRTSDREVEYTGSVVVRQLERELAGERLLVELDESRRARRMTATGEVRLVERETGRRAEGSSAVHDLEADTILLVGEPVVLRQGDGSTLRGPRLLYDVATGRAEMVGPEEGEP